MSGPQLKSSFWGPGGPLRLQNLGCARESLPPARQVHGWTEFSVTWGCTPCSPALARVEQARQVVWGIMTVMAMTLQQLRDASDEDLIKAHDDIAHALNPSVSYYLDELGRRDTERAIRADQKLAKYILYLTVANGLLAVVSICVALAAFLGK